MRRASGRKCSCLHNDSEQNCCIFMRVKLSATQDVRNTVSLCLNEKSVNVKSKTTNKHMEFADVGCASWRLWPSSAEIRDDRQKGNSGGRMCVFTVKLHYPECRVRPSQACFVSLWHQMVLPRAPGLISHHHLGTARN